MSNIIQTFPRGNGKNGGHTILDNDGNSMPTEDNLQFKGLSVTDNSTDEITEVESTGLNQDSLNDVLNASVPGNQVASNGLVYSTEEQVVGKWIDGKPLYQKTLVSTSAASASTGKYVAIGASVDKGFVVSGYFDMQTTLCNALCDLSGDNKFFRVRVVPNAATSNKNTLEILTQNSNWTNRTVYVTIQYTKTTD